MTSTDLAEIASRGYVTWSNTLDTRPMRITLNLERESFTYLFDQESPEFGDGAGEIVQVTVALRWEGDDRLRFEGSMLSAYGIDELHLSGQYHWKQGVWTVASESTKHEIGGQSTR